MADMDRVEMLLQLANNQRRDNQEWRVQVQKEAQERARALQATIARLEREFGLLHEDLNLTKQYYPAEEQMPKAVTQGPRSNEPIQRKANP